MRRGLSVVTVRLLAVLSVGFASLLARPALAIPVFARKYQTSCTTCHTAWPKLNPFGEAFRRNGFRFPGDDSDERKQGVVRLGVDAYKKVFPNAVWPDSIPDSVPIAFGFIGGANAAMPGTSAAASSPGILANPDGSPKTDAAGNVEHTGFFSLMGLTTEAHIWTGGTFNNSLSWFGEVTFSTDPSAPVDIERGYLIFDDILSDAVGQHVFNLLVGKNFPTITSFDNHSSYVVDGYVPEINLAPMVGGNGSFTPGINELDTVELNGTVVGRFDYSIGFNSGTNDYSGTAPGAPAAIPSVTPPSADAYAHVGFKLGGMRLDGEGGGQASDKPWAETALTVDVFGYHAESYYNNDLGGLLFDASNTGGVAIRGQISSFELDVGAFDQLHSRADSSGVPISAATVWGEASYVVYPWLIPALRYEFTQINAANDPLFANGTNPALNRILPAVNFLIRPNVRVQLVAEIDQSKDAPPGGWSGAGSALGPEPLAEYATGKPTLETVTANLLYAF